VRLTSSQIQVIKHKASEVFGDNANVYLFGSRLDDQARGGDIDLLIESKTTVERPAVLSSKLAAKVMIANNGLKVDVVLIAPNLSQQSIHKVALKTGVLL